LRNALRKNADIIADLSPAAVIEWFRLLADSMIVERYDPATDFTQKKFTEGTATFLGSGK
jgi:hypothetical protein